MFLNFNVKTFLIKSISEFLYTFFISIKTIFQPKFLYFNKNSKNNILTLLLPPPYPPLLHSTTEPPPHPPQTGTFLHQL